MEKIFIIDDEQSIIDLVKLYIIREGFDCIGIKDGNLAISEIDKEDPALVILDVMLPGMNGFEICQKLRAKNNQVPIIMLTAKDDEIDKILGLELGADDYLTKPFNPRELVARVKAVLRRNYLTSSSAEEVIVVGDIEINIPRREVKVNEKFIELRTQEFELLRVLAEHKGFVLSRERLLYLAWGYEFAGQTRTVDVHIAQLRKKLSSSETEIETITGFGYKLRE